MVIKQTNIQLKGSGDTALSILTEDPDPVGLIVISDDGKDLDDELAKVLNVQNERNERKLI